VVDEWCRDSEAEAGATQHRTKRRLGLNLATKLSDGSAIRFSLSPRGSPRRTSKDEITPVQQPQNSASLSLSPVTERSKPAQRRRSASFDKSAIPTTPLATTITRPSRASDSAETSPVLDSVGSGSVDVPAGKGGSKVYWKDDWKDNESHTDEDDDLRTISEGDTDTEDDSSSAGSRISAPGSTCPPRAFPLFR
jgi:hypothetical protein